MKTSCSSAAGIVVQAAYRDKIQDTFNEHFLPAGGALWSTLASWMNVPNLDIYDKTVHAAMDSMRLKVLGQETNNRDMLVKSIQMDNITFRELRQQLMRAKTVDDTKRAYRLYFALVASDACMMGTAHRLSKDGQGGHAWRNHLPGLETIMLSLGPVAFAADDLFNLFPLTRAAMLAWAICEERPTSIATLEWKTVPYRHRWKHPWQNLVDILFDVPELMSMTRRMAAVSDSATVEGIMDQFVAKHKGLINSLNQWRQSYSKILHLDAILNADLTQIGSERKLNSMGQCINVMFYYLALLCYYDLAYRVSRGGIPIAPEHQVYFAKLDDLAVVTHASESIATCLSYCGRINLGVAVKIFVCIPLTVAYRFLHRHALSVSLWKLQKVVDRYMEDNLILLSDFAKLAISSPVAVLEASSSCTSTTSIESYPSCSPPAKI